jgi:hypothetical protein
MQRKTVIPITHRITEGRTRMAAGDHLWVKYDDDGNVAALKVVRDLPLERWPDLAKALNYPTRLCPVASVEAVPVASLHLPQPEQLPATPTGRHLKLA